MGKTSVSLALVAALKKRGLRVRTFKVGPDYLDPTYLALASGIPCYNLDGWMMGKDYVRSLFARATLDADIAVIEGVMGLFDGADTHTLSGSTAEVAIWLKAPVLLVVNVHGLARSLAAIVEGYAEFDPNLTVSGVIANHTGSERHGTLLAECLSIANLPRLCGAVPRSAFPELPGRHLGLVTADSGILDSGVLESLAAAAEQHLSLDEITAMAKQAPALGEETVSENQSPVPERVRIGLAFDKAFHFYYPDNLDILEAKGCRLVRFSPVGDTELPPVLDGLYIGGGYPEEYAEQLSLNASMLDSVRRFAKSGKPIYAECGGLMYLSQGIRTLDGKLREMAGILPARTNMLERLKSLGYVEITLSRDSLFGKKGFRLRGHEFHYSELMEDPTAGGAWVTVYETERRHSDAVVPEGFQFGNVLASYVHTHFASLPDSVDHFISVCEKSRHKE